MKKCYFYTFVRYLHIAIFRFCTILGVIDMQLMRFSANVVVVVVAEVVEESDASSEIK